MQLKETHTRQCLQLNVLNMNHAYETRFSKHNFRQSGVFSKYVKYSILFRYQKLWNNYLTMAEKISSILSFLNER